MKFGNNRKRGRAEPTAIDAVLASIMKRPAIKEGVTKYKFVLHWEKIVGAALAVRTKPEGIRGKKLTVLVENSGLAQEISFQKQLLLERLTPYLEAGQEVQDIVFRIDPQLMSRPRS
jgi:predicted nucleic acid-binding Zn ribbon protein